MAALVSASLESCELGLENTGLIGGAAIGQDAGLVVKFLFAVVLNGAVAKVMCHRGYEQRTLFSTEQKYSSTFRLQHNGHVFKNLVILRMYPAELFEASHVTGTALDASGALWRNSPTQHGGMKNNRKEQFSWGVDHAARWPAFPAAGLL